MLTRTQTKRTSRPKPTRPPLTHRELFDVCVEKAAFVGEGQFRSFAALNNDDERLIELYRWTREIGNYALLLAHCDKSVRKLNEDNLRFCLRNLFWFTLIWIVWHRRTEKAALDSIFSERLRQRELFRDKRIPFDVANPLPDPRRKFRVLAEEVGEVAHAIDQIENHGMAAGNLRMELIQTAAVTEAWLESLEIKSGVQSPQSGVNGGAR